MKILIAFCLFIFTMSLATANDYGIKTIEILHRPAQELAQVLSPLLSEQGSVQVYKNTLILKETTNRIEDLALLITRLDQKTQTLIITVSQGQDKPTQTYTVNALGQLIEDHASLQGKKVYATSHEDHRTFHHVRLLSGETALIESGMSVPVVVYDSFIQNQTSAFGQASEQASHVENSFSAEVPNQANTRVNHPAAVLGHTDNPIVVVPPKDDDTALIQTDPDGSSITFELKSKNAQADYQRSKDYQSHLGGSGQGFEQKALRSGIYVTPTLRQSTVHLDIITVDERPHDHSQHRPAKRQPSYYYQKMETSMTIPLGQWTLISGNQNESMAQKNTISTRDKRQDKSSVWVRVDKVPAD